jgi:hypothetical protein
MFGETIELRQLEPPDHGAHVTGLDIIDDDSMTFVPVHATPSRRYRLDRSTQEKHCGDAVRKRAATTY